MITFNQEKSPAEPSQNIDITAQDLQAIFMQAPALMCVFEGPRHVFKFVNHPYQQLVGDRPLLGKPIAVAMPELEGQPIFGLLDRVYTTGETMYAHEMMVQLDHQNQGGALGQNYYNFVYKPTHNPEGQITGVLVFAYEITGQVQARAKVQELNEELTTLNERLAASNQALLAKNQELEQTRQKLSSLNQELEGHVQARTQDLNLAQQTTEAQREMLESLFMNAPAAICMLSGPSLVFELVNPRYQAIFPGRHLLGKPLLEALPEIADNAVYQTFLKVYQTGITHEELEMLVPILRASDNLLENRFFRYTQQPRYNAHGQIDGVLVFALEVTEQVEARLSAEASASQLALVTDALPVLISYVDREERYRFNNKAYETWFPLKIEELKGKTLREVVGEKAYAAAKGYIDLALAGQRVDFETAMPYRENFVKHIRTSYLPDVRENEVHGFFALVTDITTQVQAFKSLEETSQKAKNLALELANSNQNLLLANQQLLRTNVDLDNFIYTASHDLKAPILNIEGLMEALLDDLPPDALTQPHQHQTVELIKQSVQRFKRTIHHLTEITKLQKENTPEASPVMLPALITDVASDLRLALEASGATLTIQADQCPALHFPEKNLRSIIYNLLSNAIKYCSPDRTPAIHITCTQKEEYLVLAVQDNGLGIDMKRKNRLFEMFARLHDHVEGAGIGLYMVKRIIDNAGGKIEVESTEGEGTTFTVSFPL